MSRSGPMPLLEVDVEEMKVSQLRVDDTALAVERGEPRGGDGERLLPRPGDDAAMPLFSAAPVDRCRRERTSVGELVFLDLSLDAQDVRPLSSRKSASPFFHARRPLTFHR